MKPIITDLQIDLKLLKQDILLSKMIVKPVENRYDIIFDTVNLNIVNERITNLLKSTTNSSFDTYVKKFQAYIHTENNPTPIVFERALSRDLKPQPEYSFILPLHGSQTKVKLSTDILTIQEGKLALFKTKDFIEDLSNEVGRVMLIGSLAINTNLESNSLI